MRDTDTLLMLANHYLVFKNYMHNARSQQVPGKAAFSLRQIKKITYEHKNKTLNLYYFQESLPETIMNVDESTYDQIVTTLAQTEPCIPPYQGTPNNEY